MPRYQPIVTGFLRRGVGRVGAFTLSTLLSGLTSIVSIPFIIASAGDQAWGAVAVGQSLGAIFGVFTLLGWAQNGPTLVARSDSKERGRMYMESLSIRMLALCCSLPFVYVVTLVLGVSDLVSVVMLAVAYAAMNLGGSWFYIGEAAPKQLLVIDTLPRVASIAIGTAIAFETQDIRGYAVSVLVGVFVSVVWAAVDVRSRHHAKFDLVPPRRVISVLAGQRHGLLTGVLSSVYLAAPVLFVQAFAPGALPQIALIDRVKQQAMTVARPLSQTLQGWTPHNAHDETRRRVRLALKLALLVGTGGAIVFISLAAPVANLLGAGDVAVEFSVSTAYAVAFGANVISLICGVSCLLPLGKERFVTLSAMLGVVVLIVGIWPLTLSLGALGVAVAVAVAQSAVALFQVIFVVRTLRVH